MISNICARALLSTSSTYLDPILIYISLWIDCLFEIRKIAVCFLWLMLPGDYRVIISRNYVVWPIFLLMNVFTALKGSHFWFLFLFDRPTSLFPPYTRWIGPELSISRQKFRITGLGFERREILFEPKRRFLTQCLSFSPFQRPYMTEILLKGT